MNTYHELIEQTFDFPQDEFKVINGELYFHNIRMLDLIEKHESPLKLSYLPKVSLQIQKAKKWFKKAIEDNNYNGNYHYSYCTKSSHFSFILEEALKNDIHIETSSAYDIEIVKKLHNTGSLSKEQLIICNGFKRPLYTQKIAEIINDGFNCIPVLDDMSEIEEYNHQIDGAFNIGIRMAADEEPNFEFYTSRLGIRYKDLINFYHEKIEPNEKVTLKMLHFFINYGIKDTAYYWNELDRFVTNYCELKKRCPDLTMIDIGGGLPIKLSLGFEYNYEQIINEIVVTIKRVCDEHDIPVPDIYTEFGTFTVGESGAVLYSILDQKLQNDKELWYMIDGSFITQLPDTWGLGQRYILLPLNMWNSKCHVVNLGGLSCDSQDYYNSETHTQQVFLPKIEKGEKLYIGLFHTGAYQESIGGYGGLQHCLIPTPKHLLVDNEKSIVFSNEQTSKSMLEILGY